MALTDYWSLTSAVPIVPVPRRLHAPAVVVAALLLAASVFGQEVAGFRAITDQRVQGTELVINDDNFAFRPPDGQWKWYEGEDDEQAAHFLAMDRRQASFSITVLHQWSRSLPKYMADDLVKETRAQIGKMHGRIIRETSEPADDLMAGAVIHRAEVTLPNGRQMVWRSVIFKHGLIFMIQNVAVLSSGQQLSDFQQGFRLLHEPQVAKWDFAGGLAFWAWASLLIAALGYAINSMPGGFRMNGSAVAALLIALELSVAASLLAFSIDRLATSEEHARAFGKLFAMGLMPLFIALFFARRFERDRVFRRGVGRVFLRPLVEEGVLLGSFLLAGVLFVAYRVVPDTTPSLAGLMAGLIAASLSGTLFIIYSVRAQYTQIA